MARYGPVNGVLPMVLQAKQNGYQNVFVPKQNALEGAVVSGIRVFGIEHINELIDFLVGARKLEATVPVKHFHKNDVFGSRLFRGKRAAWRAARFGDCGSGRA